MTLIYIKTEYDCGWVKQIELRYPGRYGAPGCPRSKKKERTPEQIERQNEVNRIRRLQRIILANFRPGESWHLTLNYRKDARPNTPEQAKKLLAKFLAQVRKTYKAAGQEFKWIAVTEYGKQGKALHHHLIVEDIEGFPVQKTIRQAWKHGNTFWSDIYEDGEMEQLASYMVKMETKTGADGEPIKGTRYTHSRNNLIIPQPERQTMKRRTWPEEPRVPKGWELIKDSLYDGENPVTGYPYRHYSLRKIAKKGEDRYAGHNLSRKRHKRSG